MEQMVAPRADDLALLAARTPNLRAELETILATASVSAEE